MAKRSQRRKMPRGLKLRTRFRVEDDDTGTNVSGLGSGLIVIAFGLMALSSDIVGMVVPLVIISVGAGSALGSIYNLYSVGRTRLAA